MQLCCSNGIQMDHNAKQKEKSYDMSEESRSSERAAIEHPPTLHRVLASIILYICILIRYEPGYIAIASKQL